MKRIVIGTGLAALAIAGIAALAGWRLLAASLPQIDGRITSAGVESPVTIERDDSGVPTISAASRTDLAFATGFTHAQDRFFQMDLARRQSAGELSALIGAATLPMDKRYRLHRFRWRASEVIAALPAGDRELLERYAAGVNAGLASLGARPFEYFLLGSEPQPWVPEDTLLVLYSMFLQLNDGQDRRDLDRGLVSDELGTHALHLLYPTGSEWDAPLLGEAWPNGVLPAPGEFSAPPAGPEPVDREGEPEYEPQAMPGSNNWAIGGKLTTDGRGIVANDMHLGLQVPTIFYRARLRVVAETRADSLDVTGVTLPGTPVVVAGSNGHIAWGFTNSYGDWYDVVAIRPGSTDAHYRTATGEALFHVVRESIEIKDDEAYTLEIRETLWGPVRGVDHDWPADYALAWIAHRVEAVNLKALSLETVRTVNEALDVAPTLGIPPQNFVVADSAGSIGWTIAGRIPRRGDYDSARPADWSQPDVGWTGWLEAHEYPRIVNPEDGILWTANARVVDGEAFRQVGPGDYDLGARARQIRDSLRELGSGVTAQDLLPIQLDDRALLLERWRDFLLQVLERRDTASAPRLAAYRDAVRDWTPRAAVDSVGYELVRSFRVGVIGRIHRGLTEPVVRRFGKSNRPQVSRQIEASAWALVNQQPAHLLPAEFGSWDELFDSTIDASLHDLWGSGDNGDEFRRWGERNRAQIRHPLSRALPLLSRWLDMPADPLPGDHNMPRAQGPSFGASERFAVSPGNEQDGYFHMPAGQSGHPLSPWYASGHAAWVRGERQPFLPGPVEHTLTLAP